jgi:Na+/H+-dicarboxylate symporter
MKQQKGNAQKMLLWYILAGLILGIIVGVILAATGASAADSKVLAFVQGLFDFLGTAFVNLLKMIVQPVIIFTLIVGTASIAPSQLGKVGVKIIGFYLLTSLFAIIIGLTVGNVFDPGTGIALEQTAGKDVVSTAPSMAKIFLDIIPTNPFGSFASGAVLPTIFFSIIFGIAIAFCRDSQDARIKKAADTVFHFFEGAAEAIFLVVRWIMWCAPIGVFALIVVVFWKNGASIATGLLKVFLVVYIGLIVHLFLVYGSFAKVNGFSFFKLLNKIKLAMLTAFVTRSSGGTLPISMNAAENEMGVNRSVYSFTLPLGSTINMDGTTIYLGVCAMFICNAIGAPLTFDQQLIVILTAVLASIGTAGVPGAGAIMLIMVLESIGLEVKAGTSVGAAYAMILGMDALLDMGRTCMNVTGDMVGTLVVAKSEKEVDMSKWAK